MGVIANGSYNCEWVNERSSLKGVFIRLQSLLTVLASNRAHNVRTHTHL